MTVSRSAEMLIILRPREQQIGCRHAAEHLIAFVEHGQALDAAVLCMLRSPLNLRFVPTATQTE